MLAMGCWHYFPTRFCERIPIGQQICLCWEARPLTHVHVHVAWEICSPKTFIGLFGVALCPRTLARFGLSTLADVGQTQHLNHGRHPCLSIWFMFTGQR